MPLFGTGSTHNQGGIDVESLVLAFQNGVRLVDTAKRYGSERTIRRAVKEYRKRKRTEQDDDDDKIEDEHIFLSSKLWPGDVYGRGSVKRAFEKSLHELGGKPWFIFDIGLVFLRTGIQTKLDVMFGWKWKSCTNQDTFERLVFPTLRRNIFVPSRKRGMSCLQWIRSSSILSKTQKNWETIVKNKAFMYKGIVLSERVRHWDRKNFYVT